MFFARILILKSCQHIEHESLSLHLFHASIYVHEKEMVDSI